MTFIRVRFDKLYLKINKTTRGIRDIELGICRATFDHFRSEQKFSGSHTVVNCVKVKLVQISDKLGRKLSPVFRLHELAPEVKFFE